MPEVDGLVNKWTIDESSRIFHAVCNDDTDTIRNILDNDSSIANICFYGSNQLDRSALHLACEKGHYGSARVLLDAKAFTEARDKWHQTPLMYCVCTERMEMVELLLKYSCNPDIRDTFGKTALHYSICNTETGCLKALIRAGAQLDCRDQFGRSPLWYAVSEDGNEEPLRLLVQAGVNVDIGDERAHRSPLHASLFGANKDELLYLDILIAAGANINTKDYFCHTPLMALIKKGRKDGAWVHPDHLKIAEFLITSGQDVNVSTHSKYWYQYTGTALRMAVDRNALPYVDLLLKSGANPDIYDDQKVTPLLVAVEKNLMSVGRRLIQSNCDLNLKGQMRVDNKWMLVSPFQGCIIKQYWHFAEMLVLAGYDLNQEEYLKTHEDIPCGLLVYIDFWAWLHQNMTSPQTLGFITRRRLRAVFGQNLVMKVRSLVLPPGLERLILLADVFPDDPIE